MSTTTSAVHTASLESVGASFPLDAISTPGAYVCNWSGHLLRVPREAVSGGRTPSFNIVGTEPLTVTKISDDPNVPLRFAKRTAQELALRVTF